MSNKKKSTQTQTKRTPLKESDIGGLTVSDFYELELVLRLYDITDEFERNRLTHLLLLKADKLGIKQDFEEYLDIAEEKYSNYNGTPKSNRTNFKIDGWERLDCGEWLADRNGVRTPKNRYASMIPIQPIAILENKSTGTEKVKLQYFKNNRTRYLITERNMIASKSNIVKLASQGIEVTSENAGLLVLYLSEVINRNDLPFVEAFAQLGWQGDKFIPYSPDTVFDGEDINRTLYQAFTTKGDFEEWRKAVGEYRKNPVVRYTMAAAFSSPLLEKIGALPYVFHLWGKTGAGKTVAEMVAASIYGNPEIGATVRTLNATNNAIINQLEFLNSLPFFGDELQTIKSRDGTYDKILMQMCEGQGRSRMKDGNSAQPLKKWRNCSITTGEDKCTRPNSGGGVKNRCVEMEVNTDLFDGQGNEVVQTICENYGFAGPKYIEKLGEYDTAALRAKFNELTKKIADAAHSEMKQAASVAALLIADTISKNMFWQEERTLSTFDMIPFVANKDDIDVAERAYAFIVDVIGMNKVRFEPATNNNGEIWGGERDGVLYFNKTKLKDILQREGFELESCLRSWSEKGYLSKKERGNTVSTTVNGTKARYVALILPETKQPDDTNYNDLII